MKLVDSQGNEITSANNEEAQELEKQLSKKTEKVLEPILNHIKLQGGKIPQEQLLQLHSSAHQLLFNRLVYNLAIKIGIDNIDELVDEDDVEELATSLKNQIKMVNKDDMQQAAQQKNNDGGDES